MTSEILFYLAMLAFVSLFSYAALSDHFDLEAEWRYSIAGKVKVIGLVILGDVVFVIITFLLREAGMTEGDAPRCYGYPVGCID